MSYYFIFINLFIQLLRIIFAIPLIVLSNVFPVIRKRLVFERRNIFSQESKSFKKANSRADYFFHVSSEGELEQSRELIEIFLKENKKIEICFTSESVEQKCLQLYNNFPYQIRIYRLPVVGYFPISFLYFQSLYSFITAPVVIMCRYDFFPELLLLKIMNKRMIILSAATKKMNWFKLECIKSFDLIVAATPTEKEILLKMFPEKEVLFYDFRIPRILNRLSKTEDLKNSSPEFSILCDYYSKIPNDKKFVIASMWSTDLGILNDQKLIGLVLDKTLNILIAPHKLNHEFVNDLYKQCIEVFGEENIAIFDGKTKKSFKPVTISILPAVLCETFSLFNLAYVGGGFEKSIHSVLEPFLAGCKVIVGPKTHRSTEYDFILSICPQEISVLKNPEFFYTEYQRLNELEVDFNLRENLQKNSKNEFINVLKLISGNRS